MSANNKRGLGKGLNALLSSSTNIAQKSAENIHHNIEAKESNSRGSLIYSGKSVVSLNISDIVPNPRQPRHVFKEESLQELAASIKEHGVASPLLVRRKENGFELVAGERRLRASKLANLLQVPVIIKDMSDEESLELAIIENIQREDLNPVDEAESYQLLMKEFELTQEQVAVKVGKGRSSVANALRLIELPPEIKESLRIGEITAGHARAVLSLDNILAQLKLFNKIKAQGLNVREAEKLASETKKGVAKKTEEQKPSVLKQDSLINIERSLSSKLSTKVELSGSEQKGAISIKYFSRDDLDRIYSILLKEEII